MKNLPLRHRFCRKSGPTLMPCSEAQILKDFMGLIKVIQPSKSQDMMLLYKYMQIYINICYFMLFHCCSYFMYFQFCGLRFLREKNKLSSSPWPAITSPVARLPGVGSQVTHDTADAFVTSSRLEPSSNESLPWRVLWSCLRQCQIRFFHHLKYLKWNLNHDSQFSCLNKCVKTKLGVRCK